MSVDGSGNTSYYLPDGLGSTSQLTDSSGNITDRYWYDVFGATRSQTGAGTANDYRYTGQQNDSNADRGLYYLRARMYDPALGRFLQRDRTRINPRMPQSLDAYAYVANNPANLTDDSGLWCPKNPGDCVPSKAKKAAHAFSTGYLDLNFTGGWIVPVGPIVLPVAGTIGVQFGLHQGIHPYGGGGLGSPGWDVSLNAFPGQTISKGVNCGFQGTWTHAGVGGDIEVGAAVGWKENRPAFEGFGGLGLAVGLPGAAATCYYVLPDLTHLLGF